MAAMPKYAIWKHCLALSMVVQLECICFCQLTASKAEHWQASGVSQLYKCNASNQYVLMLEMATPHSLLGG